MHADRAIGMTVKLGICDCKASGRTIYRKAAEWQLDANWRSRSSRQFLGAFEKSYDANHYQIPLNGVQH